MTIDRYVPRIVLMLLALGSALPAAAQPAQARDVQPSAVTRVPDRVWSTQPSPPPGTVISGGVVVMTPNVVLGWGGLPPSGPVLPAQPGHPGGFLPGGPPGYPPGGLPGRRYLPPVVPPSGPNTLHSWRTP